MSQSISDEFDAALKSGQFEVVFRVDILEGGVRIASSDVAVVSGGTPDLTITSGNVAASRLQAVRRTGEVVLADTTGVLGDLASNDLIDPRAGREFRLYRGLRLPTGDELVALATLRIERASIVESPESVVITLAGRDRSGRLSERSYPAPFIIASGTTVQAAYAALVADRLPDLNVIVNVASTAVTLPELVFGGESNGTSDPNADLAKIAEAAGFESYMDALGVPTAKPYPNPSTDAPVWKYLKNAENIRTGNLTRNIDAATLRNGVTVTSTAPWLLFPVRGEAWDTDPTSPTYYDPADPTSSKVGPHPFEITGSFVTSEAQAQTIADAKLPDVLGIEETFEFSAAVHPGLEPSDVIEIETKTAGTIRVVLDSLTTPAGAETTQGGQFRRRRR